VAVDRLSIPRGGDGGSGRIRLIPRGEEPFDTRTNIGLFRCAGINRCSGRNCEED
jgi:hypothetical protein